MDKNVKSITWSAKSPDLNIIENVWGLLARQVYANGRQFSTVGNLRQRVVECWDRLHMDQEYGEKLFRSIPGRLTQVLEKKGGKTSY